MGLARRGQISVRKEGDFAFKGGIMQKAAGEKLGNTLLILVLQIVNPKGEMKGSAITGPVGKEAAELWPVRYLPIFSKLGSWC